jgi:hypothetical protein
VFRQGRPTEQASIPKGSSRCSCATLPLVLSRCRFLTGTPASDYLSEQSRMPPHQSAHCSVLHQRGTHHAAMSSSSYPLSAFISLADFISSVLLYFGHGGTCACLIHSPQKMKVSGSFVRPILFKSMYASCLTMV